MTSRVVNYYSYSLSNSKTELNPDQFSKALYFTIHLIRSRSKDLVLDTIHFDDYAKAPASVKREYVEAIIETLNQDLELQREKKRKKPVKKKPAPKKKPTKRKPKKSVVEVKPAPPKRKPIRHEYDLDKLTTRKSRIEKLTKTTTLNTFKEFEFDLLKSTGTGKNKKFRKVKTFKNATDIRIRYGDVNEGYREIETIPIPQTHLNDEEKIKELINDIFVFKRNEFDSVLEYYGTRYFQPNEFIVVNDVLDLGEFVIIDLFKGLTDRDGKEYYVRKFYMFYLNGVEISNPNSVSGSDLEDRFLKFKTKLLKDYKKLCDYAFKRRMTSAFIYRALYSMDTYADNLDDVFIAQGVGIGRRLTDTTKKAMYLSAKKCLDAILLESGNTRYLERYRNIFCDGFSIENDSRNLKHFADLGKFEMY